MLDILEGSRVTVVGGSKHLGMVGTVEKVIQGHGILYVRLADGLCRLPVAHVKLAED